MPTREPLLLSNPDAHMPPANFRGHLGKSSQEATLSSCSGQLPYPRRAGEDGPSGEAPAWGRSPSLSRAPRAKGPCSVSAVPSTAPPRQQCAHLSAQHMLSATKGGRDPFRCEAGPGDGSCGDKSALTYGSSRPPLPPFAAPQGGPCVVAQPRPQPSLPPRGSEGDGAGGCHRLCLNYCSNDMFFNLYPLRWLGSNVRARPSSDNASKSPPPWPHRCESATTTSLTLAPLAGLRRGFHTWRLVFVLFIWTVLFPSTVSQT